MERMSVKLLRRAVLALMLGASCHVQSAQVVSLELSLSAADLSTLVNRSPFVSTMVTAKASGDLVMQSLPELTSSAQMGFRRVTKDEVAFASAASTNGWLKGMAFPGLMLAGFLVLTSFRQQKTRRITDQLRFG